MRLIAHVCFGTSTDWSPYRPGIIDTGAAVSLLPLQIWKDIEYDVIGTVRVGGIVGRDECRIPAQLARVTCALSDGSNVGGPLTIHAYLAESNEVPLLLGVSDLIERGHLSAELKKGRAFLEI